MIQDSQITLKDFEAFFADGLSYAMPQRGSLTRLIEREAKASEIASTKTELYSPFHVFSLVLLLIFVTFISISQNANAESRLKDIASFEGVRDNMLIGYGLVVGLNGTGDKLKNNEFTTQSLIAFLERQGVNTRGTELKSKNIAAVTVTATLPPFARVGSKINVSISAMGDAKSLQGGMLLATALYGADSEVYVVSQGAISIAGFEAGGGGTAAGGGSGTATITKGVPTNGFIANGGIVEKEINFSLNKMSSLNLSMRNPDLSTAKHVAEAINKHLGVDAAQMIDPATVRLRVPIDYKDNTAGLLAEIENVNVKTDQIAKVVIDEASGTIVMGENVRIDTVAVAQGNLIVKVEENPQVSQPNALSANGTTEITRNVSVSATEENSKLTILKHGASLRELIAGLNALGVGPRDLITILQTIKTAGALQAEIIAK